MNLLDANRLTGLSALIQAGAEEASKALTIWTGESLEVLVDELQEIPLEQATEQLGQEEQTVCACLMRFSCESTIKSNHRLRQTNNSQNGFTGQFLLAFDDASGLRFSDRLLNRQHASTEWEELERSAILETTNIVGCAFLNAMARSKSDSNEKGSWLPTPPVFVRDYAASIMQFALMGQAQQQDSAIIARTRVVVDGQPIGWRMLLIPDSSFLESL